MKKLWLLPFFGLMIWVGCTGGGGRADGDPAPPGNDDPVAENAVIRSIEKACKIETLYSVNGEHPPNLSNSNDWARMAPDGTIGMVYGEPAADSCRLIFKTIASDGSVRQEDIARGVGVENCVLLYDAAGTAHIFTLPQDGAAQDLVHFSNEDSSAWRRETVCRFDNPEGEYVVELEAAMGPNGSIHLTALQFGMTPDHFYYANYRSNLFYIAKGDGQWHREPVDFFDSVHILRNPNPDRWYMRALHRQDLTVDASGRAHIVYGAIMRQTNGYQPTEVRYATNAGGRWTHATAIPIPDMYSDAGYNPVVAIDSAGMIALACTYMPRVATGSAIRSYLLFARLESGQWRRTVLTGVADGYFGADGGQFSGAIPHLLFDAQDRPQILFADITSTHFEYGSFLTVGQVRLIRFNGLDWEVSTLYRQPGPRDYDHIDEIHQQCLLLPSPGTTAGHVIAEEYTLSGSVSAYHLVHIGFE